MDAEQPGEQRSGQVGGELEQCGRTGLPGADAELAEAFGELVGADRVSWLPAGKQPWGGFLAAVGGMAVPGGGDLQGQGVERLGEDDRRKGLPQPRRAITVKAPGKLPRVLAATEVQAILDACDHLRDRFLLALMWESGCRVGEALGLRHEDIAAAEREVTIVPRVNANKARCKSREQRTVPVSAGLIRLWGDYLHREYGQLDSDYVFVNLFAEPRGQALSYPAVYDLVIRLRKKAGFSFGPHWLRHTAATRMLRDGVPIEVVSKILGHSSVATTSAIYGHLTAVDARRALEAAGWFTGTEVSL